MLCPNHHTEIDKNEADWPVERLHFTKSKHELWVSEKLSESVDHFQLAKQVAVTSIIDAAVELCDLDNWQDWTFSTLAAEPSWPKDMPDRILEFASKALAGIWPDEFKELKNATMTFSYALHEAAQIFLKHSKENGDELHSVPF